MLFLCLLLSRTLLGFVHGSLHNRCFSFSMLPSSQTCVSMKFRQIHLKYERFVFIVKSASEVSTAMAAITPAPVVMAVPVIPFTGAVPARLVSMVTHVIKVLKANA